MLKKILIIVVAVLVAALAATSIGWYGTSRVNKVRMSVVEAQNLTIEFQRRTIDSLLSLPPAETNELTVELHMDVTDKSKLTINGKGNSGTITVPTERKYTVEVDSAIFNVIRKADFIRFLFVL